MIRIKICEAVIEMFTVAELVKVAGKIFKMPPALVESALKAAGMQHFTLEEAQKIVAEYAARPVTR